MRLRLGSPVSAARDDAIRRLAARDPSFHSICDDYRVAQRALKHWQAAGQAAPEGSPNTARW